ncbi:PREDICTED: glucan endo-1 [Prunus dulcis]|uniref:glucan endo-1,3-beta-D-glucosidase n=1 Tax=Prunus dulcis TaxID=3755 RepID=A0A5E4GHC4_PRUDU|nr:PREDICTED: glucan endo-1 [Prunus dulcis]
MASFCEIIANKPYVVSAFLLLGLLTLSSKTTGAESIGVCYGRVANNLPPDPEVISLYRANGITRMRIFDPNPPTLQALKGSNIELIVGVRNQDIQSLGNDVAAAAAWVQNNVLNYFPDVKFRYIAVGNEIKPQDAEAKYVLAAMKNIKTAIASANLQDQIKVSTAMDMSLLGSSYPPSTGSFSDAASSYINPIIAFLASNGSPFLANVYPYFSYIGDTKDISLGYALFAAPGVTVQDGAFGYTNLFAAAVDALYSALEKAGGSSVEIVVSETGWPSEGGEGATVENASTYYKNLIDSVKGGTPKRRGKPVETYLFAMFDENQKGPAEIERHFGLFSPDKQPKYQIRFNEKNKALASRCTRIKSSHLVYWSILFSSLLFFNKSQGHK